MVWCMNLKDNRDIQEANSELKFRFCRDKGIVAIGWVNDPHDGNEPTPCKKARKAIGAFVPGDLVWVRHPVEKKYYICEISAPATQTDDPAYHEKDIGIYCKCTFAEIGTKANLPKGITYRNLISRSAIRKMKDPKMASITEQTFRSLK